MCDIFFINTGIALWQDGKYSEAQKVFEETIQLDTKDYRVYHNYGTIMNFHKVT